MWILAEGHEPGLIDVEDPYEASVLGSYWNAVRYYLDTGFDSSIMNLAYATVRGYRLEIDVAVIEEYARRGGFDFDSIYALPQ
jgi:hypothetical protein